MDLKTIIAALGPAETDSDADVLKHVIKPGDQNRTLTEANAALTTERDKYKKDFDELKASADGSEKTAALDAAVADKRINAKEKDIPAKLDIADVKTFLADRKAPQHPAAFIGSPSAKEGHENRTFADRTKQDPAGLAEMKTNDPEAYKTLYKAEYGKEPKIN